MVASARVAYLARRGADYGVSTGPVRVDMGRVRERKRSHRRELPRRQPAADRGTDGLDLICGEARFIGPSGVAVDGRSLLRPT